MQQIKTDFIQPLNEIAKREKGVIQSKVEVGRLSQATFDTQN